MSITTETGLTFPAERKQYNNDLTLTEPLFVSDVVNANENVKYSLYLLFKDVPFVILDGLVYDSNANTYGSGYIWAGERIYYVPTGLAETKYLTPSNQDEFSKEFGDASVKTTYTSYQVIESNSQYSTWPQFNGTMDKYRVLFSDVVNKAYKIGATESYIYNGTASYVHSYNASPKITHVLFDITANDISQPVVQVSYTLNSDCKEIFVQMNVLATESATSYVKIYSSANKLLLNADSTKYTKSYKLTKVTESSDLWEVTEITLV